MKKVIKFLKKLFGLTPKVTKPVATPKPQQRSNQKPQGTRLPKSVEVKEGIELTETPKPKKKRYYRPKQKNGNPNTGNGKQTKNIQ